MAGFLCYRSFTNFIKPPLASVAHKNIATRNSAMVTANELQNRIGIASIVTMSASIGIPDIAAKVVKHLELKFSFIIIFPILVAACFFAKKVSLPISNDRKPNH